MVNEGVSYFKAISKKDFTFCAVTELTDCLFVGLSEIRFPRIYFYLEVMKRLFLPILFFMT